MLRKKLAEVAQIADFRDDILAKLMILEYAEPNLFTELYGWQAQNRGYAPLLKEFEKKKGRRRNNQKRINQQNGIHKKLGRGLILNPI